MVEHESEQAGVALAEQANGLLLDLGLDAAAAQGADLAAVGIDEHPDPRLLGRRAFRLDDLAEQDLAPLFQTGE